MGAVYEATHARLAGRYAVKLLLLQPTVGSEAIALFDREARITSLLQHPNIVQIIDHNTTADGTEYLVMEYLAGESLAQRLQREAPLPLDTVVGIVDQIAAGLSAAHASRVVHRNLKPDNVFLVPVEGREAESVRDPGLRDLEGEGLALGPSGARGDGDGHAALHGARADRGPRRGRGRRDGSVRARRDRLRDADRPQSFPGRDSRRGLRAGSPHASRRRWASAATSSWWCAGAWPSRTASGFPPSRISPTRFAPPPPVARGRRSGRRRSRTPPARSPATTAWGGRDDSCGAWCWTLAAVAGIAIAFVVGGVWNQSRVAPRRAVPVRGGGGRRRDRGTARRPGSGIARSPGSGIERRPGRRRSGASRGNRGCSGGATADCARDAAPSGPPPGPLVRPAEICSSRFLDPGRRCDAARHRAVELNGHLIHIDLIRAASGKLVARKSSNPLASR